MKHFTQARLNRKQKMKWEVKKSLVSLYGSKCYYCDKEFVIRKLTLDHIYPVSKRKLEFKEKGVTINSCVLACESCNFKKGNRVISIENFRKEIMGDSYYPFNDGVVKIKGVKKHKPKKHELWADMKNIQYPENPIVKQKFTLLRFINRIFNFNEAN